MEPTDERFAAWRAAAELPTELSVHCLRHSYISHSVEDGVDPLFIQYQAGHSWASTTAGYTNPQVFIGREQNSRSPAEQGFGMARPADPRTRPERVSTTTDPVGCMIIPDDGSDWRVVWGVVIWPGRPVSSWCLGWRCRAPKTPCSKRCCVRGGRSRRAGSARRHHARARAPGAPLLGLHQRYPWGWLPGHVEEFTLSLISEHHLAPSTIRNYQVSLRLFSEFLTDPRYGWVTACEEAFGPGMHPVAICHEWNTIAHLGDYEGDPEGRPFSREEMQRFLDYADEQVERAVRSGRKGALAAYRDATIFKVLYGWGLRRTECSKLDVLDWGTNPAAPEFGRYGTLHVRYGKAKRVSHRDGATCFRSWTGRSTRWPTTWRTSGPASAAKNIRHCG